MILPFQRLRGLSFIGPGAESMVSVLLPIRRRSGLRDPDRDRGRLPGRLVKAAKNRKALLMRNQGRVEEHRTDRDDAALRVGDDVEVSPGPTKKDLEEKDRLKRHDSGGSAMKIHFSVAS
jgi:hypothetical protein